MDLNGVIAVLFVLALIIVIGAPGCQSQPPDLSLPRSLTADLKQTDKQAEKVRKLAQTAAAPLPAETTVLHTMTGQNLVKSAEIDKETGALYEGATAWRDALDEVKQKAAAQERLMLYLKIGSLAVLAAFAGIIAFKTSGDLRTWVLLGLGGTAVGVGISIALDFIAPYVWILVALVVIAAVAALGRRLGWWEWAALGIAEAVKDTKAVAVATAAADKTPDGLGAVLKKEGLFIQPE